MSRGMGVVRYCTPEGGSGYVPNPYLPWVSTFDITQQSPVYDQTTAWMREQRPGQFTNYSRFGPPYSMDGGVLPPYYDPLGAIDDGEGGGSDKHGLPIPAQVGCGMGAVDPDVFAAHYGRPRPPEATCLQIQCRAIPQEQAGMQLIQDCANAGWSGVRSCNDPVCAPWLDRIPGCAPRATAGPSAAAPAVLLRSDVVASMPSITTAARRGCTQPVSDCPSDFGAWVESNPWLVAGLALAGGFLLFGGGRR